MNLGSLENALINHLGLSRRPIGMSFLADPPEGVPRFSGAVPSACSFWAAAENRLFFAEAADHFECPVGTMAMGFSLPEERRAAAEELIGEMIRLEYLTADEVAKIPAVQKPHRVIVYGPLSRFDQIPDSVLVVLRPAQAMVLSEAAGSARWAGPVFPMLGRPTCGAIPESLHRELPVVSSGCIGARVYAELKDEDMIMVLPGTALDGLTSQLSGMVAANQALSSFHTGRKKEILNSP